MRRITRHADRFDVVPLLVDYWRMLRIFSTNRSDTGAKLIQIVVPIAAGVSSYVLKAKLTDPGSLLSALALLAGVLLAAFGQVAMLRIKVEESPRLQSSTRIRRHFRESAAQLLTAALVAGSAALVIAAGSAIRSDPDAKLGIVPSALAIALSALLLLLFLATTRRMYTTYIEVFENGRMLRAYAKDANARDLGDDINLGVDAVE